MRERAKVAVATVADRLGVTRLIASLAKSSCILVLAYHRIGNSRTTSYDPDVFSATAEAFYDQVAYLKSAYGIATLDDVLLGPGYWPKETRVLLTFDDGYIDNYRVAYPILRSLGVQGTFLLPTGFVGSNTVPWWDAIAHMIIKTSKRYVRVPSLTSQVLDRSHHGPVDVARQVLQLYRDTNNPNPRKVLEELSDSTAITPPCDAPHRRFLNWEEAREMLRGGMAIGSHSRSHPLMGGMPVEQQQEEAIISRQEIVRNLQIQPRVFALPCGSRSPETTRVLTEAGYEMILSTERGPNAAAHWNPLWVRRWMVDPGDHKESTHLRLAIMANSKKASVTVGVQ